jgi:hypothetical protein
MSWQLQTRLHPAAELEEALDHTTTRAHISKDQLEQSRAAKAAAMDLVRSGALGDPERDSYTIALSGHAGDGPLEPGHVTINVSVQHAPDDPEA